MSERAPKVRHRQATTQPTPAALPNFVTIFMNQPYLGLPFVSPPVEEKAKTRMRVTNDRKTSPYGATSHEESTPEHLLKLYEITSEDLENIRAYGKLVTPSSRRVC